MGRRRNTRHGGVLRLIPFVDPDQPSSVTLLAATLKAAAARADVEVVAIVDVAFQPSSSSPLRLPRALARWGALRAFNLNTHAEPSVPVLLWTCESLARHRAIPVLAPGQRGVNDPAFVESLRALAPDAALSLMVGQIFAAPLLEVCGKPINYHDGLLPRYQGVAATAWSIYERAGSSGFTFHVMTEEVDRGPVLLQGAVDLAPDAALWPTARHKTRLAGTHLGALLELLACGPMTPRAPAGLESRFTRADLEAVRVVAEPDALTAEELLRRLRAFETLELTLSGERANVTELHQISRRRRTGRLAFTSADGVRLEASRIGHLPPAVRRFRESRRVA
jgi:methionyl-tRNA formyltransferase